jgi:hypothetical protein
MVRRDEWKAILSTVILILSVFALAWSDDEVRPAPRATRPVDPTFELRNDDTQTAELAHRARRGNAPNGTVASQPL